MQDFGTKADNSPPPGGQLSAAEFNNLATENENAVSHSGQTLSGASATQLAQSLFLHGVKAESFQDSGAANAYVATPISGTSGVLLPADYSAMNGAVISLKASNANSAASTLNIGQTTGTLLGTKPIRTSSDTALPANTITAGKFFQVIYNSAFDTGNGAWEFLPWASAGRYIGTQVFNSNGTYTPTAGTSSVVIEMVGGGGAGGGAALTAASNFSVGGGGGAGSYTISRLTTGFSGTAVVVGAGGTPASGVTGGNGGSSSFGSTIVTAAGGLGGSAQGNAAAAVVAPGGGGGALGATGTILNSGGATGQYGIFVPSGAIFPIGGPGASSAIGAGGFGSNGSIGGAGLGPGGGGGGSSNNPSQAAKVGGAGSAGTVLVHEYA